jgi:hypothetical protein
VEGKVEGERKENNEAEERARKALKKKDETKIMAQKHKRPSINCTRKLLKYQS